eukprot:gene13975-16519_t
MNFVLRHEDGSSIGWDDPGSSNWVYEKVAAKQRNEVRSAAAQEWQSICADLSEGNSSEQLKEKGKRLFRGKKYADAAEAYSEALLHTSDDMTTIRVTLLSNRAQCYLNTQAVDAALRDASQALALDKTHAKSWFRRAHAFECQGLIAAARADLAACAACTAPTPAPPEVAAAEARLLQCHGRILRRLLADEEEEEEEGSDQSGSSQAESPEDESEEHWRAFARAVGACVRDAAAKAVDGGTTGSAWAAAAARVLHTLFKVVEVNTMATEAGMSHGTCEPMVSLTVAAACACWGASEVGSFLREWGGLIGDEDNVSPDEDWEMVTPVFAAAVAGWSHCTATAALKKAMHGWDAGVVRTVMDRCCPAAKLERQTGERQLWRHWLELERDAIAEGRQSFAENGGEVRGAPYPNDKDTSGRSDLIRLHAAATAHGARWVVEEIEEVFPTNVFYLQGATLLHMWARAGRVEVVKFMLQMGACPGVLDTGRYMGRKATPLDWVNKERGSDTKKVAALLRAAASHTGGQATLVYGHGDDDAYSSEEEEYEYGSSEEEEYGAFGFTLDEEEELLAQGIKPWDEDAAAALDMINNGY